MLANDFFTLINISIAAAMLQNEEEAVGKAKLVTKLPDELINRGLVLNFRYKEIKIR